MADNDPIYERRVARRETVVAWVSSTSFGLTTISTYLPMLFIWSEQVERLTGLKPGLAGMLYVPVCLGIGALAMLFTALAVERIHRTLWPEHPDDGNEQ